MGLFDFVKNGGANVFGAGKMDSAEVESYLRTEFGERVTSLKAAVEDGTVRLVGICDTQATMEKVVLMAGNIKGVEKVNDHFLRVVKPDEVLQKHGEAPTPPPAVSPEEMPPVEELDTESLEDIDPVKSRFYTIQSGDTLSGIAKQFYGDPMKYTELFEANKEVIKDANLIYPGQTIRIPE